MMADRKRNMMKEEEKQYEQKTRATEKLLPEAIFWLFGHTMLTIIIGRLVAPFFH